MSPVIVRTGDAKPGDGRVQVGAAAERDVDAAEDGQAPPEVDQQPAAALTLAALEDGRGDDAATQQQQHRRARDFGDEDLSVRDVQLLTSCRERPASASMPEKRAW